MSVCPSICRSVSSVFFPRIADYRLVFSDFWHNGRKLEYLKTDRALFSRKIQYCPILHKKGPKWLQNRVFWSFWKILSLVFLGNNLKWKLLLLIFHYQSHIWQNSGSCVMGQNDVSQSNWWMWMMKFIFGMQINNKIFYKLILSFWVCVTRHAQSTQNNKFAISLQHAQKEVSDEWR